MEVAGQVVRVQMTNAVSHVRNQVFAIASVCVLLRAC